MSNETDLDWLARNVQPLQYGKWVRRKFGFDVSGSMKTNGYEVVDDDHPILESGFWIPSAAVLARRAELQSVKEQFKPSIEEANRLAQEFKPFISIEDNQEQDMKQDNGWHERGDLPPVGVVCEAYIDRPPQWIEAEIVAHKDGFAIGWCKSVMKGCHGDKASEFRPIRTDREQLTSIIDGGKRVLAAPEAIADAILAAGFSLSDK